MLTPSPAKHARRIPRRAALVVVLLAASVAAVGIVAPARADAGAAAQLVGWVGQERAAAGVQGLAVADDLVAVATRHAQRMAAEGRLYHNPALGDEVSGWQRLTENVGHGPEARPVHDALMASASHRANILDTAVTQVGVGTARGADGTLWVAQVFRLPTASSPPPPQDPAPGASADEPAPPAPAPPAEPAHAASRPLAPPAVRPAPAAVAPAPPVLTFTLADVEAAPAPASIVGPADRGEVRVAPSPVEARVLDVTRWLVVVSELLDG